MTDGGYPQIDVGASVPLGIQADTCWAALIAANDPTEPTVVVRGDALGRMTEAGELGLFTRPSLRDKLSLVATFWAPNAEGRMTPRKCPTDVVEILLARDSTDYPDAPRVDRIVTAPVVASDETIVTTPGCHADSRLWYRPARGLDDVRVPPPGSLTTYDVTTARWLLMDELLGDFVWADEASKANALGLLLLPFVRDLIDGPTPMHAILAADPGTGKSLLAETVMYPAVGTLEMTPDAADDAEWRKRITASLMKGQPAICIDNVKDGLGNPALAAALTSGVWSDRVLGVSTMVTIPVRNAWICTGNNTVFTRELARRTIPIFLEADDRGLPSRRTDFRHRDLRGWTHEHRAELVGAALVLVRNWLDGNHIQQDAAGRSVLVPGFYAYDDDDWRATDPETLGSFPDWARVVGGILAAADVHGFLQNREAFQVEANVEEQELAHFLATWHDAGIAPMKSAELMQHVGPLAIDRALHDALPSELAGINADRFLDALRMWLRSHRGSRAGGYQLVVADPDERRNHRWLVRQAGEPR